MSFDDRKYTADAIIKQLGLIELHSKDGSAVEAGCQCIETKHLFLLEGLAEEGQGFAMSEKERQFYVGLADTVRKIRKRMEVEDWTLPKLGNPHSLTCERKLESCVRQVQKTCKPPSCNPYAVCRATLSCS